MRPRPAGLRSARCRESAKNGPGLPAPRCRNPTRGRPIRAQTDACATAAYSPDSPKRAFVLPIRVRHRFAFMQMANPHLWQSQAAVLHIVLRAAGNAPARLDKVAGAIYRTDRAQRRANKARTQVVQPALRPMPCAASARSSIPEETPNRCGMRGRRHRSEPTTRFGAKPGEIGQTTSPGGGPLCSSHQPHANIQTIV